MTDQKEPPQEKASVMHAVGGVVHKKHIVSITIPKKKKAIANAENLCVINNKSKNQKKGKDIKH